MKHMPIILPLLALLASCGPQKQENPKPSEPSAELDTLIHRDDHNARNSLDYEGTYAGKLPCADCEGIETEISLSTDGKYGYKAVYKKQKPITVEKHGSFIWKEDGNTIKLEGVDVGSGLYFVEENKLVQLDSTGNRITGKLAEFYVLSKQEISSTPTPEEPRMQAQNRPLEETRWVLTELNGKPIKTGADKGKEAFLMFRKKGNRIEGNASCNSIGGSYEIKPGNKIIFSQMFATKMACMDMTVEDEFLAVLNETDSYSVSGNSLLLSKGKGTPSAKFRAK